MSISYSEVIYNMSNQKDKFNFRKKMVKFAKKHGKNAAQREFDCSINTVIKWVDRFEQEGDQGLFDKSRAPNNVHNKMSKEEEEYIVKVRERTGYGAKRLKYYYDIDWSEGAIYRVLKQNNCIEEQKKKHEQKRDLRAIKRQYKAFERIMVDVKHLQDIPNYWAQMMDKSLPKYQYTARDVKTGALFLGFGDSYCVPYSEIFVTKLLEHLNKYGISLDEIDIKTDNGTEFSGNLDDPDRGFVNTVEEMGANHIFIPPNTPNANADVETSHRLIEDEFYDIEHFDSRQDFYSKVLTYQYFWNIGRINLNRDKQTPLEILSKEVSGRRALKLLNIKPIILSLDNSDLEKSSDIDNINLPVQHPPDYPEKYQVLT